MGSVLTHKRWDGTTLLISLCLLAATIAVYWPLKNQGFILFDDDRFVTENHHVREGVTLAGIAWAFTDCSQDGMWIPLTWLSLMVDSQLYDLNAGGYKITNLMLHLANILLLFMLLNRMTGKIWRSAFVAALFALHPLHVESVAWVTERKDVLSTLFWLLTMWAYLSYAALPSLKRYLWVVLALTLGLMAKPMLVTLPFALLLLDYWPLHRLQIPKSLSGHEPQHHHRPVMRPVPPLKLVREKLPLVFLAVTISIITFTAQNKIGAVMSVGGAPVGERIANSLVNYVIYIRQMIWPHPLGVLYPHSPLLPWQVAGAALLLASVSTLVLRAYRRHPYLPVGWFWYLGTLLPTSGLVTVGIVTRADRFTYVPGIGLLIILAWGLPNLLSGWRRRQIVLSLAAGVCLAVAAALCRGQVQLWQNSATLFEHTIGITANNSVLNNNLGLYFLDQGEIDKAVNCFLEAIRIDPSYAEAHNNLGFSIIKNGRIDEAMNQYAEAIRLQPDFVSPRYNLGDALVQLGKLPEAIAHYTEALRLSPDYAPAHIGMGIALAQQGKIKEATDHFSQAIRLEPNNADVHFNLGLALGQQGEIDKAISHFSQALQLNPDFAEAHSNLGLALSMQGKTKEAEFHFSEAIRLNPDLAQKGQNNTPPAAPE
jgi:tetratricopeptide (TPR) repeat protein